MKITRKKNKRPVRLMPFRPMFFDLVISVGQKKLLKEIILKECAHFRPAYCDSVFTNQIARICFQPIKMKALCYLDCCRCYVHELLIWPWVAGNEVIVKNVNANIPVSLSWFLLSFLAFLCFPASAQFIASSS